jgi:hypothetical protein
MIKKLPILLALMAIAVGLLIACQRLRPQPAEGTSLSGTADPATLPAESLSESEALLAFARCMQTNGVPDFPDPQDGGLNLLGTGIDRNSAAFKAAEAACTAVKPVAQNTPIIPGASEWEKVVPGSDSMCADGSEFVFWTRAADPVKVVFFLEGGGACWGATTCAFTDNASTTYDWNVTGGDDPVFQSGIFDLSNPNNPFADYSFVFVPYCTGDVHLGARTQEYAPELTVAHNGFVNGATALDYLASSYPDAQEIIVVGESAGAVAAPVYGGLASDALPNAEITVLADSSGAYPDDPELNVEILGLWGVFETMPDWAVNEKMTAQTWGIPRFWVQTGLHNPDIVLARFDYAFDQNQVARMMMLGLDTSNLVASIDANEAWIEDNGVVQHSYTAPGSRHTIMSDEEFYTLAVNGVTLLDWVEALIAGEPLDDVHCDECVTE